jgi:hypothetical protein
VVRVRLIALFGEADHIAMAHLDFPLPNMEKPNRAALYPKKFAHALSLFMPQILNLLYTGRSFELF